MASSHNAGKNNSRRQNSGLSTEAKKGNSQEEPKKEKKKKKNYVKNTKHPRRDHDSQGPGSGGRGFAPGGHLGYTTGGSKNDQHGHI